MNSNRNVCPLVLLMLGLFASIPASAQNWIADRKMAADLVANGVNVDTERATLWFQGGILSSEEMNAFGNLANQGIQDIEAYLGITRAGGRKIRYYITTEVEISHSRWQSIYLPMSKVQNRTAPYLHETTHIVAPCDACPMWFSEGLASFVQSYVSEHTGGYDGGIFTRRGNRGIDQDARRWLASDRGRAVAPFVGVDGEPPSINEDRQNVAAPFYVMAQSFVKFLAEKAPLEKLRPCFDAKDFDGELQKATGKNAAEWKELWLAELAK
jgi:hypothetical protein